jgi:hypothetical protein
MAEEIFYESGNVKVTNARFIVDSQTYAMNGVTSVKGHIIPANRTLGLILLIVGLLIFFGSGIGGKLLGLLVAAAGGYLMYQAKATHAVMLHSSSGEAQALSSTDEAYIKNVINALNEALIHRG